MLASWIGFVVCALGACVPPPPANGRSSTTTSKPKHSPRAADAEHNAVETRMRSVLSRCIDQARVLKTATHLDVVATAITDANGAVTSVNVTRSDGSELPSEVQTCSANALRKERFEEPENQNTQLSFGVHLY